MTFWKTLSAIGVAVALTGATLRAEARMVMGPGTGPARAEAPADRAFAAANGAMMRDMAVKPTGRPDRDFVAMMLPHHQGAVAMARVELRYGTDPALRRLAASIVSAQEREIAVMRRWQARHR